MKTQSNISSRASRINFRTDFQDVIHHCSPVTMFIHHVKISRSTFSVQPINHLRKSFSECIQLVVFRNYETQKFYYKSLLSQFSDHFNVTYMGIYYFKQIFGYRMVMNAKANHFQSLFHYFILTLKYGQSNTPLVQFSVEIMFILKKSTDIVSIFFGKHL